MPMLTMVIDYKTQASCIDDVISISTESAVPADCQDVSQTATTEVKAAAQAFLKDLGLAGGIHAVMTGVQPAFNQSFKAAGREGGFFSVTNLAIE
jgi:hypothetical protein